MKLVRITHYRCGDYDCNTFALAPDEWGSDRIESEVLAAQDAYLEQVEKARKDEPGPPNPGYHPDYKSHPDKTVLEVQVLHAAAKEAYDEWEVERSKTRRAFENFLTDQGFVSLWNDDSGAEKVACDWGHKHGWKLQYGDEKIDAMPTPAKVVGMAGSDDDDW